MEAKVSFHVRQYLRECEERGVRPSDDTVTAHLRETHAEYQRKPLVRPSPVGIAVAYCSVRY